MSEKHENIEITEPGGCGINVTQVSTVSQPVMNRPFVVTGPIKVECEGRPVVEHHEDEECSRGRGGCRFVIKQKIKVDIPMEFGATVRIGDSHVECGRVRVDDKD